MFSTSLMKMEWIKNTKRNLVLRPKSFARKPCESKWLYPVDQRYNAVVLHVVAAAYYSRDYVLSFFCIDDTMKCEKWLIQHKSHWFEFVFHPNFWQMGFPIEFEILEIYCWQTDEIHFPSNLWMSIHFFLLSRELDSRRFV